TVCDHCFDSFTTSLRSSARSSGVILLRLFIGATALAFLSTGLLPLKVWIPASSAIAALPLSLFLLYGVASVMGFDATAPDADDREASCIAFSCAAKSAA